MKQNKWNLIVIPLSDAVSGKGMYDLINTMLEVKKFKYMVLDDIEGVATDKYLIRILRNQQYTPWRLKDLMPAIKDVDAFEWGSFFLFEDYPDKWDHSDHFFEPYLVGQTDSTIRAMDGNYAYIYTPYDSMVEIIKKNYETEEVKIDFLENLDYPF